MSGLDWTAAAEGGLVSGEEQGDALDKQALSLPCRLETATVDCTLATYPPFLGSLISRDAGVQGFAKLYLSIEQRSTRQIVA
jgi:hypothetical protein